MKRRPARFRSLPGFGTVNGISGILGCVIDKGLASIKPDSCVLQMDFTESGVDWEVPLREAIPEAADRALEQQGWTRTEDWQSEVGPDGRTSYWADAQENVPDYLVDVPASSA